MSEAADQQVDDLHRLLLRKFTDADQQIDIVDGVRRNLVISRRIEADLKEISADIAALKAAHNIP